MKPGGKGKKGGGKGKKGGKGGKGSAKEKLSAEDLDAELVGFMVPTSLLIFLTPFFFSAIFSTGDHPNDSLCASGQGSDCDTSR